MRSAGALCFALQGGLMKRLVIALSVVALIFPVVILAQTQAPKPDPGLKKLQVLVGHWTYEGEYKAGPLGPGGKITGEYTGEMILGGFFYQDREIEKGSTGEMHNLGMYAYDPVNKNFAFNLYQDDGSTCSGTLTISGNTLTWAGKLVVAGKQYQFKEPFILTPDLMTGTAKCEISVDGNTWIPFFEGKFAKAKPAPKK
jgi:hypothetical protein